MVRSDCPRLWEIDALREGTLSSGEADSNARHRATCDPCRQRLEEDEALAALGRALPAAPLHSLRMRRIRSRMLSAAAHDAVPKGWRVDPRVISAVAGLAALVVMFVWSRPVRVPRAEIVPAAPTVEAGEAFAFAARVEPWPQATWTQQREGGTERVQLAEGALRLTVRHQTSGERFMVAMPDGEVEVRGTRFDVTVDGKRTRAVHVTEGVVALRINGQPERILVAGDQWIEGDEAPPTVAVAPVRAGAGALRPDAGAADATMNRGSPDGQGARVSPVDAEYARAFDLYQRREYERASRAFHAFSIAHPTEAEAADAEFLEASALAYAGQSEAAAIVAARFLGRWPNTYRARDAAVLVARAARDRGDCPKARAVLAPWSNGSPPPDVAVALGACGR